MSELSQMDLFAAKAPSLQLRRPLAVFDIESTGIDYVKDRIIDLCIVRLNVDGSRETRNYRLNPTIPIPAEASMIHGIYDEDVVTAPTFKDKAQEIFEYLDPCDLAGFNSNKFDVPLLLEEFIRCECNLNLDTRALVDVHRIFTHFEKRTLEAAYKFYCNKNLDNAHNAEADTVATLEVLLAQINRYEELKGADIRALHDISNEERIIDSGRRFVYMNDRPVFNFGKYKGRLVEDVLRSDPGYYNWMLDGDFAMHTKQKLKDMREQFRKK